MPTLNRRIATLFLSLCAPLLLMSPSAGQVCEPTITTAIGGVPRDLAVKGDTVYAAAYRGGLMILDISDPERLAAIGRKQLVDFTDDLVSVTVDGNLLYAIDDHHRMHVLGISNPKNPSVLGIADQVILPFGLHIEDQLVCSYSSAGGLSTYDFSNPLSPQLLDNAPTGDRSRDLAVEGGFAYLADQSAGLRRFSLIDRGSLSELPAITFAGDAVQVEADDGFVYVLETNGNGSTLLIIDVSDPFLPMLLNSLPVADGSGIRVSGSTLYIGSGDSALRLIDVSDPQNPVELGTMPTPGTFFGITLVNDDLLLLHGLSDLVSNFQELLSVDTNEVSTPAILGRLAFPERMDHAEIRDGLVYVTNGSPDLQIYDCREPGAIKGMGSAHAEFDGRAITLNGDLAYVVHGDDGLAIFDVQDPLAPFLVGARGGSALNLPTDIAVSNGYAYVSRIFGAFNNSGRLVVMDVSDPESPQYEVSAFEIPGRPGRMQIVGDLLYIALVNRGIDVIDISDPTAPSRVSTFTGLSEVYDFEVVGETIYTAAGFEGFGIIDARDPGQLLLVREVDVYPGVDEETNGIRVANRYAFLTSHNEHTLYTLDFSNPFNIALVDMQPIPYTPLSIDLEDDLLIVTKDREGLDVIEIGSCLVESCAADLNKDGIVDGADLGRLVASFMQADSAADINGDGIVDQSDLGILISQFGVVCSR